jgi:hypothetical protein
VGKHCAAGFPLGDVLEHFDKRGYRVTLSATDLADNRLRSMLLSIVYLDRLGTSPFDVRFKGNEPHIDHIYPQSMLRSRLEQLSATINDIGNLRYVGATDNIRKRAELPAEYFTRLKRQHTDVAKHLLVHEYRAAPERLRFDEQTFRTFRTLRRNEIYRTLKRVVDLEERVPSVNAAHA